MLCLCCENRDRMQSLVSPHVDSRNVCAQSAMNRVDAVARVATCVLGNRKSVIV